MPLYFFVMPARKCTCALVAQRMRSCLKVQGGKQGEVEEGNAIYCWALRKQGNPWGISTNVTRKFANVISDFSFENKVSAEDAEATRSGCRHRRFWSLLWVFCAWRMMDLRKQEPSSQRVPWLERSQRYFSCARCLMI